MATRRAWPTTATPLSARAESDADRLIRLCNAAVSDFAVENNAVTNAYHRYPGRLHDDGPKTVNGLEERKCREAWRDDGAGILMRKCADQLRDVVPHTPYIGKDNHAWPFSEGNPEVMSRLVRSSEALIAATRSLVDAQETYHGKRYQQHATPLIKEIGQHIAAMKKDFGRLDRSSPENAARYEAEAILRKRSMALLDVLDILHDHAEKTLGRTHQR